MNRLVNAAKGFLKGACVPPIVLEKVEHGFLGPQGPGMLLHLSALLNKTPQETPVLMLRVFHRGLRIASWEAEFADRDGTLMSGGGCTMTGAKATSSVWLPYGAVPTMVEGALDIHAFLHAPNLALLAEGRQLLHLAPFEERMRASALGALVDFVIHVLRPFSPIGLAGLEYLKSELVQQFDLSGSGIQTLNALIRMAVTSPQPEWKTLWHVDQFYEAAHHEFILNLVVETAQVSGLSTHDFQASLTELASILRIEKRKVQRACTRRAPCTSNGADGGAWGHALADNPWP